MELNRITLPPLTAPGEVTTFYCFEGGTARSIALSNMAMLLAGRENATVPVLMIDWDTEAPGLHHHFDQGAERPGLLEYFEVCKRKLAELGAHAAADDAARARQVLDSIDWEAYVERVDQSRPLYLMRAGRFDDSYGERADGMDWDGLFAACPALFRSFGEHLTRHFRHVLIDARSGRSAAVSICTTLLPHKLVALFTPSRRSLDGLVGVVTRAIDYRCSHEDEQRALLVYPVPALVDSADCERRQQWRRGDPRQTLPGYQPVLEKLLRRCYGLARVSLESYLDEVQLQQSSAMSDGERLSARSVGERDRFSPTRTFEILLDWVAEGRFPWQSHAEVDLLAAVAGARALHGGAGVDAGAGAATAALARHLLCLGQLYREQGRPDRAGDCLDESAALRARLLGDEHADTRAARAALAALRRESGALDEARTLYERLGEQCLRLDGRDHPATRAARAGLAATLAQLGESARALALHDEINDSCERTLGPGHPITLDSLVGQAETLRRQGELGRARMVYERVLEGRERLLGTEHEDTLRCTEQLAVLLGELGDAANARKLQEIVVATRERRLGHDHADTQRAREALGEIVAAQGDLGAVARVQQALARARERCLGAEHPETLSIQLQLASTLGQQGDLESASRLQQHVVSLQERVHGSDNLQTLHSKQLLAATLSRQGHSLAARKLEDSVLMGSDRLLKLVGMSSGPHDSHVGALGLKAAILDARGHAGVGDTLDHRLAQLQELIDSGSEGEARALADSLRKSVLRPSVAHSLRRRAVAMIRQVYLQEGDKDALLAFAQDEVSSLEGALIEACGGRPVSSLT